MTAGEGSPDANYFQMGLERLTGRAHEIAQRGDVRSISTDAAGIYWQAQQFSQIQIEPSII